MSTARDYYVYVYIDPRNFEEFYYGMGRGTRKNSHLYDPSDSNKTRQIAAIREENLQPIIRVIARGLTQEEALLIEKTLLWKLGKYTTNIATGHFAKTFRPQNTMHKPLIGFDYSTGIYYYNVGECIYRNWGDFRKYGFISAGRGTRYRDAMLGFNVGDIVVPYFSECGYVGIGKILSTAQMFREVEINGQQLHSLPLLAENADHDSQDDDLCEYVCKVRWIKRVSAENAKWKSKAGLYTNPAIRASLEGKRKTIRFLENEFNVSISNLLK